MSNSISRICRLFIAGATLFLWGCAQAPDAELMVVGPQSSLVQTVHHTLLVDGVTGGQKTNPLDKPKLGNDELHQALVASLRNARIFDAVSGDDDGRLTLRANIEHQELSGVWENVQQLAVSYSITDTATGTPVWSDTFYSLAEMGVSDVFVGQERMRRLLEAVVQDNLVQLIVALGDEISANPEFVALSP